MVNVTGEVGGAYAVWEKAARALDAKTRAASDCASIVVRVTGKGARLVYSTSDGRLAQRELTSPKELEATITALMTLDAPAEEERPVTATASAPNIGSERSAPAPLGDPTTPAPAPETAVVYGALAGARAGAGGLASPTVDVFAAVEFRRWQFGVIGRYEPRYGNLVDRDAQPRTTALATGLTVGRRERFASDLWLDAGGALSVAMIREESSNTPRSATYADGRIGAYVGLVAPRRASTRFRVTLIVDMMPPRAVERSVEGTPLSPWWAASLSLGLERGGP